MEATSRGHAGKEVASMELRHSLGLISFVCVVSACGVGKDANVGGDSAKHLDADGGHAAGSGGDTSAGGSTHSGTGGAATGTGGATHSSGGATQGTGGTTHGTGGLNATGGATHATGGASGGVKCGNNTCAVGDYCCNASCGICAPRGAACIQIACDPPPPDAGTCVDNVACIQGTVWSKTQCKCVPATGGACTTAADCHLVANYCGDCNCLSLATGEKEPVCTGGTVSCFADPCLSKTPACVTGHSATQRPDVTW
jgi:hypothetical protein